MQLAKSIYMNTATGQVVLDTVELGFFISANHQIQIEAPSPQHAGVVFIPVLLDPKGTVNVEHNSRSH